MSNAAEDIQEKALRLRSMSVQQWLRNTFNRLVRCFKKSSAAVETKEEPKPIKLKSMDEEVFEVDREFALESDLIKEMLNNFADEDDEEGEPMEMSAVDGRTLKKILEYCEKHKDEEYTPKGEFEDPRIQLTDSDKEYMVAPSDELVQLLLGGANSLDVNGIITLINQKIASMSKEKTIEELREIFDLENDFTPEDEEEIRQRFAWVEI